MIQTLGSRRIRVLGRCTEDGGMLWMVTSLSEAGFRVTGATEVRLRLRADDSVTDPGRRDIRPRYAVRLDGEKIADARMAAEEETVTVFRSPEPRTAEVRLIKLSEGTQSLLALREIVTDGDVAPLPEREKRIEFIGDSITAGYGVETPNPEEGFTTATENAEKSYAALTADALGMDRTLTCFSGHGIVSGYTGDPTVRNGSELVPPYYEATGRNGFRLPSGRTVSEIPWDFSAFRPDIIVINLGTNDLSWTNGDPEREAEYRKEYAAFLKTVRRHNPQARIVCVLGLMGGQLNGSMTAAVGDYRRETGDRNIHSFTVAEQDGERNGYGANYHPSEKTQRLFAETVTAEIKKMEDMNP